MADVEYAIKPPARQMTEFEENVYSYMRRMCQGSDDHWDIDGRKCNLRFESATRGPPAKVSFTFTITPDLSNYLGNLHGGCAATLIDVLSSTLLVGMAEPGKFAYGGVSRNLRTTYLRPVPVGTEARLVCELIHAGQRLALLRAEIQKASNGDVCVVGEHEKANTDPEVKQRI
ncbi:hypothetical protein N7468_005632 [Penicillium chermesinum]|uniref:Thioesterase domain-containing protein n=1 Tax=Penicillium chermesinum TaxID=63820 RepID=A0A9W9NZW7_9EURO|nr:uncharacterized protein N7468_005632 [Penicillium chermesinum]KAJ5232676.1 hypothetical protein N7468_005632 [Penicillium chermesinum]KAJ6172335.1 hypothetical protein N7470_001402 [Penicillium chermesinum]